MYDVCSHKIWFYDSLSYLKNRMEVVEFKFEFLNNMRKLRLFIVL